MTAPDQSLILQLCPNDHPPFRDICAVYQAAGESLGCRVETLYFSPAFGEPLPGAHYLDVADLTKVRAVAQHVRQRVSSLGAAPMLALCHRYRAYRVLRATGIRIPRVIAIAHEFGFFRRLQRRLERRLLAREVLFAGVSPAVTAELAEAVPQALCLPNGIDVTRFRESLSSREGALAELGLEPGPFTVAVSGRLIPWKRPGLAVDAIRALAAEHPNVRLVLLGEGELREHLEQQAEGAPVRVAGFVPDARRLLPAFDALLIVSEDREAFGMVALEAMAAGVPVVAGPSAGPRSVIGDAGWYYTEATPESIAATLAELVTAENADEVVEAARSRVERGFSVSAVAARLDDLFFRTR